jgi:hypothetical protein
MPRRVVADVHSGVQWITRGDDDLSPGPLIVTDDRLAEMFFVLAGSHDLMTLLTEGAEPAFQFRERRLDTFPTMIQRSGSAWSLHRAFVYFMPPLRRTQVD